MEREAFEHKYQVLYLLKSIQEYLKSDNGHESAVFPLKVPRGLLANITGTKGPENADKLLQSIFELGLKVWSEQMYLQTFGSARNLEDFVEKVKNRNRERQK
jgi:hypothetical protein